MGRNVNEDAARVGVKVGELVAGGVLVCVGVLVSGAPVVPVAVGVRVKVAVVVGVRVGVFVNVAGLVGVKVTVGAIKLGVRITGVAVAGGKFTGRLIASTSLPANPQALPSK